MIILGIDPGIGCTGYGLLRAPSTLVEYGTFRPPAKAEFEEKLLAIADELEALIQAHRPEHCAVESVFHAVNARSALVLGHVRGVVVVTAMRLGCKVFSYSALQIKKAVTGYGKAEKEQVRKMVRVLLDLPDQRLALDSSDALAAALCHAETLRTRDNIRRLAVTP